MTSSIFTNSVHPFTGKHHGFLHPSPDLPPVLVGLCSALAAGEVTDLTALFAENAWFKPLGVDVKQKTDIQSIRAYFEEVAKIGARLSIQRIETVQGMEKKPGDNILGNLRIEANGAFFWQNPANGRFEGNPVQLTMNTALIAVTRNLVMPEITDFEMKRTEETSEDSSAAIISLR